LKRAFQDYPQHIDALFGISDTILLAARDAGLEQGVVDARTLLVGLNGDPDVLAGIAEGHITATVDIASERLGASAMHLAHEIAFGGPQSRFLPQGFRLITRENLATISTQKLAALASVATRVVGYNRMQEQDRLNQMEISMQINRQVGSLLERKELFQTISQLVAKHYGYAWMSVLRWSEKENRLVFSEGNLSPGMRAELLEQDELVLRVFEMQKAIYIPDTQVSQRWHGGPEWCGVRSRAVLPIPLGDAVIGVLDLQADHPVLDPSMETIGLEMLASQLGIAIQNVDLYLEALQARQVAERANQLKTRLVANVGHEMRTPLNAILGFSQAIQDKLEGREPISEEQLIQDIRHVYASGEHLMYMINDLLDLSRAEIGALTLYYEPIQPERFLKEVFENFTRSTPSTEGVRWELDVPDTLPMIRADVVRLRQIISNLLSNSAKFTNRGVIRLGAQVELPYLHIWVEDSGPGVPLEIQERIFEPFNTVRGRRRPEGIGLGLSITRHLVNLHNGLLTLESQPGAGSIFHIYLPLPGVLGDASLPAIKKGQPTLLVISLQPEIPEAIQQIANRQELNILRVSSSAELLHVLENGPPAAVAWDLAHASAIEWGLVNQLGSTSNCTALPLILFGGETEQANGEPGLTKVLYKPYEGNTLKDWIGQMRDRPGNPVLVVDDDLQAAEYCRNLVLSNYPQATVVLAHDGRQALDWLVCNTPSLILLDLMMSEVDGFEVLDWVRSEPRTRQVPVVVVSGKLLTYEDVQRLSHAKTALLTKDVFTQSEAEAFLNRVRAEELPLAQPTSQLTKQSLAYLHEHYALPLSRKEIAAAVGVTENYLSQIFRAEVTISPWDYLNRYRILRAKELLCNTNETVMAIAGQVGFNDSAYFSRVFRRITGQSPQGYRSSSRSQANKT
jgi:signal transduction histidine kinase/AraC-like DNA-binding protein